MPTHPLDDLIDDINARPIPYATVAAVGVAAAMLLATRAMHDDRSGVRKAADRATGAVGDRLAEARDRLPDVELPFAVRDRESHAPSPALVGRSTVAMILGALLVKALAGRSTRRDGQQPRSPHVGPAEANGADGANGANGADDHGPSEQLHDMTVPELRTIASERDIAGRSSMKKDELVDALAAD